MSTTYNKHLAVCSFAAIGLSGLLATAAGTVLPIVRERYALSYDISGILLALLSVGNLTASFMAGVLPRKIGRYRTLAIFAVGAFFGYGILALPFADAAGISGGILIAPALLSLMMCLGYLFIGFAKGNVMNNVAYNMGVLYAEDRTKGQTLLNAVFAIGALTAPFFFVISPGGRTAWNLPIILLACAGAVMWICMLLTRKDIQDPNRKSEASASKEMDFLRSRHFWYTVAFLFGQQCAEISVTGWLVTYFKDSGILSGTLSQFTVTIIWGAMLVGRLTIAFVLKPGSIFRSLIFMSGASLITYVFLLLSTSTVPAVIFLILFGLAECGCYPTGVAQAGENLSAMSLGVMLPAAGIGAIVMPYITGAVAERVGIRGGMACVLAALAVMLVFSVLLKAEDKKHPDGKLSRQAKRQGTTV